MAPSLHARAIVITTTMGDNDFIPVPPSELVPWKQTHVELRDEGDEIVLVAMLKVPVRAYVIPIAIVAAFLSIVFIGSTVIAVVKRDPAPLLIMPVFASVATILLLFRHLLHGNFQHRHFKAGPFLVIEKSTGLLRLRRREQAIPVGDVRGIAVVSGLVRTSWIGPRSKRFLINQLILVHAGDLSESTRTLIAPNIDPRSAPGALAQALSVPLHRYMAAAWLGPRTQEDRGQGRLLVANAPRPRPASARWPRPGR